MTTATTTPMQPSAHAGKQATLLLFALLISHFVFDYAANSTTSTVMLLVKTLPLLPVLPGMLRNVPRAYIWLCFILLLYFLVAVQYALDPNASLYDYTVLTLITLLFTSAMMTARWLARSPRPTPEPPSC